MVIIMAKFKNKKDASAYYKARYLRERTLRLAQAKLYRDSHKIEVKNSNKKWRLENKEYIKIQNALWRLENKVALMEKKKQDYEQNKSYCLERQKKWYSKNKAKALSSHKTWVGRNKRYALEWHKAKLKSDIIYKLRFNMRGQLSKCVEKKQRPTKSLLQFDFIQLKVHLEKQFDSKMSWANYGSYWQIDHVVPISWFKTEQQIIQKGFALKNLQPLSKELNFSKNNCYVYDAQKNPDFNEVYFLPAPKGVDL